MFLNGKRATIGNQVKPSNVESKKPVVDTDASGTEDLVLIALNKPVGIAAPPKMASAITLSISLTTANACSRLAAGLDKDSQGLIILTNHGDLVNKILRAGGNMRKSIW